MEGDPGWSRAVNALGRALQAVRAPRPLDGEDLLAAARRQTGLDDFGAEFGDAEAGVRAWAEAAEREAGLSPLGRVILRLDTIRHLRTRLRVIARLREQPAILDEPVVRPLFVIGLPRSGTTLLHRLLACTDGARAPLTYELFSPLAPPPGRRDRRPAVGRWQVRLALALQPGFGAIHPMDASGPEEEVLTLQQTFVTAYLGLPTHVPSYLRWLEGQDQRPTYRYHRAVLQAMQHGQPAPRWVLKAPIHLFALDALLALYPDACVVHIHRNVLQAAPSGCSLIAAARGLFSDRIDRRSLGPEWVCNWGGALDRAIHVRDQHADARFCDVRYDDLVADPAGAVGVVLASFGEPLSPAAEARINRWLEDDRRTRRGPAHHYTLDEFGLDRAELQQRFAGYSRRFGLAAS